MREELFSPGKNYYLDFEEIDLSTNTKTIILPEPIQRKQDGPQRTKDGAAYKTLELHKPTPEQMARMEATIADDPTAAVSALMSSITGIPLPVIEKIEKINLSQWEEARNYLLGFGTKEE
jgi:hypothetical protein